MQIELITTPNEALKESGFGSLNSCQNVIEAIQRMGHETRISVCKTKSDLDEVINRKPDLVVLAVKYVPVTNDHDIWLSDYFSMNEVNFTGSSKEVLGYDSNKVHAKIQIANKGIKTARYFIAVPEHYKNESELPVEFPLFLKPLDAANGNGIDDLSFVTCYKDYKSKVASLNRTFNQPILAEEYLGGREFTVAVIKTVDERLILSAVEIIPPTSTHGLKILGSQTKKDDSESIVKIIDDETRSKVISLATDAFNALGIRDFGRIDIKTDKHGECYFMEANMVPGLTYGSSYFPQACKIDSEFTYDKVIELLLAGGMARALSTVPPHISPSTDKKQIKAV